MIFIALCTYQPDLRFLREQIDSIRAQTYPDFHCLIQDDASRHDLFDKMGALIANDGRFTLRRNRHRMGVFHNFEEALYQTPTEAKIVCYSDQDDVWLPNKLQRQVEVLSDPSVSLLPHGPRVD
jgi:glycosyltransferase involved in cell wall biosynthesis